MDWGPVATRIAALKPAAEKIFGSPGHHFEFTPRLRESEVAEAEAQWRISFPDEYRSFLLEIGAGGAGPHYGLFPLTKADGVWAWRGDGGDMTTSPHLPWRHDKEWNLEDHPLWDNEPDEDDEKFNSEEEFEEAYEAWYETFTEIYWNDKWTEGAICLCHEGCALRDWLVVTGAQRGEMWWDGSADRSGLMPCETAGKRLSFAGWYLQWLEKCEQVARGESVNW